MADIAFITGATGFVGTHVARALLQNGYSVRVLARKKSNRKNLEDIPVDVVEGDLLDTASLQAACRGAKYVFHVAADYRIWVPNPDEMYAANVQGTRNVLKAACQAGAERIVHCSSVAAIKPPHHSHHPVDESSSYSSADEMIGVYKKSKWLSEKAVMEAAEKGAPVVVVNPAAPIGSHDVKPTPTGRIILNFLNGKLPSYIDTGLNVVHVQDVAQGHYDAAIRGRIGERYILGCHNITFKTLLDALSQVTGLPAPRIKTPYPIALAFAALDTMQAKLRGREPLAPLDAVRMAKFYMFYDSSKAVRELNLPQTPLSAALRDAVRWFTDNGYVQNPDTVNRVKTHLHLAERSGDGTLTGSVS